jgi:hypothetical protein
MTRHTVLLLVALWCALPPARAGAEPPELAWKYRFELEVRKPEAPRTIAGETYYEATTGRLYYAGADNKALALTACKAPDAAKGAERLPWVRGFALPVRGWDAKEFDKDTPKVTVEVFRDAAARRLIYATESGALAAVPEPVAGQVKAGADPRWLYRLQLKVRPAGENDFIRNYLKLNVEVYLHEPTGHLIYVGHNGALAVVETKKNFADLKAKPAVWSHALELKARKLDQKEFTPEAARIAVEVYSDDNAGVLLYATDALTFAAVPRGTEVVPNRKWQAPEWKHRLQIRAFAAEVFADTNTGHTIAVTPAGAVAVLPGEVKFPERADLPAIGGPKADALKATGATVCELGVLSPSGKVLFLPGEKGVDAVAVFNGKLLWSTDGAGAPLLSTAEYVVSQVQVKGKKNQVRLVVLDAATGERLREPDVIEFPEWVSVPLDYGHRFRSAARLDKDGVLLVWEAYTFQDGGPPPPPNLPNLQNEASGAFRLDVKTGRVSVVKDVKPKAAEFPDWTKGQTKVNGWVYRVEEKAPEPGFPHVLTARALIAEREDGKGAWKRPIAGEPYLPPRP